MAEQNKTVTEEKAEQKAAETQVVETKPEDREPNNRKVRIRRKLCSLPKLDEQGDAILDKDDNPIIVERYEMVTRLPYEAAGGSVEHANFPADKDDFDVAPIIAAAAVATGFFEEDPASQTKLKR